jgi:hypothetical protein
MFFANLVITPAKQTSPQQTLLFKVRLASTYEALLNKVPVKVFQLTVTQVGR